MPTATTLHILRAGSTGLLPRARTALGSFTAHTHTIPRALTADAAHSFQQVRKNRYYEEFRAQYTGTRSCIGHASKLTGLCATDRRAQTEEMPVSHYTFQINGKETHLYLLHHDTQLDPLAYLQSLEKEGNETPLRFSVYPDKRVISIVPYHEAEHFDMWRRLQQVEGLEKIDILTSARGYVKKDGVEVQNRSLETYYPNPQTQTRRDDISEHIKFMYELGFRDATVTFYPKMGKNGRALRGTGEGTTTVEAYYQKKCPSIDKPEEQAEQAWVNRALTAPSGSLGRTP